MSEPEYISRDIPTRIGGMTGSYIPMINCTRCGAYVWDMLAHENFHEKYPA